MRSTRLVPLVVLVLAFLGGFWLLRRSTASAPAPIAAPPIAVASPAAVMVVAAAPSASPSPRRISIHTETEIAAMGVIPEMESITTKTADDYIRRARYPRASQPIDDSTDPIIRDREVTRGKSAGPEGSNPTLIVWPERTGFEAPSPIVLFAYLVHDERKVDAKEMRGEIRTQEGGVLAALAFHDDGAAGDATSNDFVYTAVVTPGRERALDFKGAQLVEVQAVTKSDEQRVATTGFLYSVPLAHLTGRYRDEIVDGNLVVSAEVQVDATARFHLEATLADPTGAPFGWAQNAQVLDAGTGWIPLTYWGLMFHEHGVAGPYRVASVALSTTGEMPNQKNDAVYDAHMTKAYDVSLFSDRRFDDPGLLDAAARLQADAPLGGLEAGAAR